MICTRPSSSRAQGNTKRIRERGATSYAGGRRMRRSKASGKRKKCQGAERQGSKKQGLGNKSPGSKCQEAKGPGNNESRCRHGVTNIMPGVVSLEDVYSDLSQMLQRSGEVAELRSLGVSHEVIFCWRSSGHHFCRPTSDDMSPWDRRIHC